MDSVSGKVASAALQHKIDDIESGIAEKFEDEPDEETKKSWWSARSLVTRLVQGGAMGCAGVNITGIVFNFTNPAVMIASGIAVAVSLVVFMSQCVLEDMDTLRQVQNALRKEVNRMNVENTELEENASLLETQVDGLKEEEEKLDAIAKEQGSNVESLVGLVKTNGETLADLKECVKAKTQQTFLRAVLDSDFDQNNEFSNQDLQMLEFRMKSVPGIHLNHDVLLAKIRATDRSLSAVASILVELDDDEIDDKDRAFVIDDLSHMAAQ